MRCFRYGIFAIATITAFSARADAPSPAVKTLDGYFGVGVITSEKYVGGAGGKVRIAPLPMFDYRDTFYIHMLRAGVRLWSTDNRKLAFGIAAEPRFGYRAKDGARLGGMTTRRDRIEGGPSIEWETPAVSFDLAYFTDWTGAGGGESLRFSLYRQLLDNTRWDVGTYAGLEHDSSETARYYFGVRADEVTPARPYFNPNPATNSFVGFSGAYKLEKRFALLFGADTTFLGSAIANSPIVERKYNATAYCGIALAF